MMTTDSTSTGLSGLLPQILGGLDENGVLDSADSGEFVQSLAGQIKSLMLQRGDDPIEVAAIDDASLVAQFFALVQGQSESSSGRLSVTGLFGERALSGIDEVSASADEAASENESTPVAGLGSLPTMVLDWLSESGQILPQESENSARALPYLSLGHGSGKSSEAIAVATGLGQSTTVLLTTQEALGNQLAPTSESVDSTSFDLEALTRLLRQTDPSAASGVTGSEISKDPETVESTSTLPSWLARQSSGDGAGVRLAASISASSDSSILVDESLGPTLEALQTSSKSGDRTLESVLDVAAENTEIGERNDLGSTGSTRSTSATETPTTGARLQTLDLNRLLQPGGEQRLAEQVRWSVDNGLDTAEIKLHPPSLGALDVRLVQEGDKTHVQFVSAHPIAREVLEAAMPRLREALAQDGVLLGNVSVSDQAPQDRGGSGREGGGSAGVEDLETEDDEDRIESRGTISVLSRRLDVFT